MEDQEIINMYLNRDESAISATAKKYGNYCYSVAYNILYNKEDAEESVNDTYLEAWNSIPPHEPEVLSSFLGKITRYVSLKRRRDKQTQKRGGGGAPRPDKIVFLQPASSPLSTPLSGISVTGLGYENGKLHVQICYEDISNTDNHGWIWLQNKNGELMDCSYSVSFWDPSFTDSYEEYIFELPYEELGNYKIYAEFTNSNLLIAGDWQITFPMEQVK